MSVHILQKQLEALEQKKATAEAELEKIRNSKNETVKTIQNLKAKIKRRENAEKRKERTKRLIIIGAELESALSGEVDIEQWKGFLQKYAGSLDYLKKEP